MTVEECVYWMAVADAFAPSNYSPRTAIFWALVRHPRGLTEWLKIYLGWARHARSESDRLAALVAWRLCREAIRAVERERSGR